MSNSVSTSARGSTLAMAFAGAAGLWGLLYIIMSPAIAAPPWMGLVIVAGCPLLAGWATGRRAGGGLKHGVLVGVSIAGINLVILGSLVGGSRPAEVVMTAVWWVLGCSAIAVIAATIGAVAGRRVTTRETDWTAVLAAVLAFVTLAMIASGGIVTGLEAGLAIRGWWTSNDYPLVLFPLHLMRGEAGVFAEHAHRLWGLLVGLTSIALTVQALRDRSRRWLLPWAIAILLAVIIQGVLGGTRVIEKSIVLAIIHGVFGQVVLAAMVGVAAGLCCGVGTIDLGARVGRFTRMLVGAIVVQLALGASYRHLSTAPDVATGFLHGSLGLHVVWVLAVVILAIVVGGQAASSDIATARRIGRLFLVLIGLQLVLGLGAVGVVFARGDDAPIPWYEVLVTTAHQMTGATLLSLATALAVVLASSGRTAPASPDRSAP